MPLFALCPRQLSSLPPSPSPELPSWEVPSSTEKQPAICFLSFFFKFYLFLAALGFGFVAACGLSLVVASRGYSLLRCAGFSLLRLILQQSMGSRVRAQ